MTCYLKRSYSFLPEEKEILLKHFGGVRKMARTLGLSPTYVCDVLDGKAKASAKFMYFLSQHFDIKQLWYNEVEEPPFVII